MATDWTWSDWGSRSIGWRLEVAAGLVGRVLWWVLKAPFMALRAADPWVKGVEHWGIFLGVIALGLSLVAFWTDYSDRVEERTVRAWQLLTTPATGNSGKREALEYLNRQDGLWCGGEDCLISLKAPTALVGIDLSSLETGEGDGPAVGTFLNQVELRGANLEVANLGGASLRRANLERATLYRASLQRADLEDANLEHADLELANLEKANLRGVNLREADLDNAQMRGADLTDADLSLAFARNAKLNRQVLRRTNLQGANFLWADFEVATFASTILDNAVLISSNLWGSGFFEASLVNADLSHADLRDAVFWHSILFGAKLEGADLRGADLTFNFGLTQGQLSSAIGDATTVIPEGLTRPEHWSK